MYKITDLLEEVGVIFETDGHIAIFDYTLDGETVMFQLRTQPRTGYYMLTAVAGISVDQANVQEVVNFLNKVNIMIPFGCFVITDGNYEVGFRDTLRFFGELPSAEEFLYLLDDYHSLFLTYAKITLSINAQYSAEQAMADLLQRESA
jgi:hypothetical protein